MINLEDDYKIEGHSWPHSLFQLFYNYKKCERSEILTKVSNTHKELDSVVARIAHGDLKGVPSLIQIIDP